MNTPRKELADVFRLHGDAYRKACEPHMPPVQLRAMEAIADCRTAALGGHVQQCDSCGHTSELFNSCRNRNCPKCQNLARARWLEDRKTELLPVEYFHVVFTVPAPVAELAFHNRHDLYTILFHSVRDTLVRIAADPKHLGAQIGVLAVLHTWGQNLHHHPHIHCVVPSGGLSHDGTRWVRPRRKGFLFPVRVLSRLFRGIFLDKIRQAHAGGTLQFRGNLEHLGDHALFDRWVKEQYRNDWVVYAKRPFAGPEQVLEYLARYTHRTAIANSRIVDVTDDHVTFKWRDYRIGHGQRTMTLPAQEFIRRFLMHVLPKGTVRIRYFGFLANRHRSEKLEQCRRTFDPIPSDVSTLLPNAAGDNWKQLYALVVGHDPDLCRHCNAGRMRLLKVIPSPRGDSLRLPDLTPPMDSS